MMGIMVAICKIIEKDRDNIMRVLNFYIQEINFYFKRFLPCLWPQRVAMLVYGDVRKVKGLF